MGLGDGAIRDSDSIDSYADGSGTTPKLSEWTVGEGFFMVGASCARSEEDGRPEMGVAEWNASAESGTFSEVAVIGGVMVRRYRSSSDPVRLTTKTG